MNSFDQMNAMHLFANEIRDAIILHIPHSSIEIPNRNGYLSDSLVESEIIKTTDWCTDEIFNIPEVDSLICKYSRVFCDVERLHDSQEELYKYGRGFYYTKTDAGLDLRNDIKGIKYQIYNEYYLTHHQKLKLIVDEKLKKCGIVRIVDCHSFPDIPFNTDIIKKVKRPDICIGTDTFHTPQYLLNHFHNHFVNNGFSVEINSPYSGTIIPMEYFQKNKNIQGIMIEINRRLYMENDNIISSKVLTLNHIIKELFEF